MAWDGTLTPPPIHNEKAKKGNGSTMYQNKHIFIFFFCFSSYILEWWNRIKLYWITTYIDQLIVISILEIPKDSGIIQIGQVRHIIHFIKFGRIDLENLLFFQILFLKTKQIIFVVWSLDVQAQINTYLIGLVSSTI